MGIKADMEAEVSRIFGFAWNRRDGRVVPAPSDIALGNHGVNLEATVLYADLRASTALVDSREPTFAAEIYKSFLACAARIVKHHGGVITSYDGDRIMGVYVGESKSSNAAKTALRINWAVREIIRPRMSTQYPAETFKLEHTVGIDTSKIMAARTGVRGDNDIVWVGRAANHAAKLSDVNGNPTWISEDVYKALSPETKYSNGTDMWQPYIWTEHGRRRIYGSGFWWALT